MSLGAGGRGHYREGGRGYRVWWAGTTMLLVYAIEYGRLNLSKLFECWRELLKL